MLDLNKNSTVCNPNPDPEDNMRIHTLDIENICIIKYGEAGTPKIPTGEWDWIGISWLEGSRKPAMIQGDIRETGILAALPGTWGRPN